MKNTSKLAATLAEKLPISKETATWLVQISKGKSSDDFRPELLERLPHFELMTRGRCVSVNMKENLETLGWTEGAWCNAVDTAMRILTSNGVMKLDANPDAEALLAGLEDL